MNDILHEDPNVNAARKKWLDYLREPGRKKYRFGLVKDDDAESRCCLGHACFILGARPKIDRDSSGFLGTDGTLHTREFVPEIAKMLDVDLTGGFFKTASIDGYDFDDLSEVNDYTTLSMNQIADFIEEQMRANNFQPYSLITETSDE